MKNKYKRSIIKITGLAIGANFPIGCERESTNRPIPTQINPPSPPEMFPKTALSIEKGYIKDNWDFNVTVDANGVILSSSETNNIWDLF